jgi:hypothetical protein
MRREELVDLNAFLTVAEERSFTRAAAKLGTSQSALSYTIRRLETRLGIRVFQDKGPAPRPTNRDWRPPGPRSRGRRAGGLETGSSRPVVAAPH